MSTKPYVQKYLWRDHRHPFAQSWQLTLTNYEAIAFLGFLTIIIAYSQSQIWVIIRSGVKRATRPIQLPDADPRTSFDKLTQREAIRWLIISAFQLSGQEAQSMKLVSVWFGALALANIVAFIMLGVIIPWALTGAMGTPVVQSKFWDGCLRNDGSNNQIGKGEHEAYLASDKYQRCWFNTTSPQDFCSVQDGILVDRPELKVHHNVTCPFAKGACYLEAGPLKLEYTNLTMGDLGLNLEPNLLLSRNLTCAPLNLDHFMQTHSDNTTWLQFRDNNTQLHESGALPIFRQPLSFADGRAPRPVDDFHSFWLAGTAPDLRFWEADFDFGFESGGIHPDLVQSSGSAFVLVYNAGRSRYTQPIDDPMYSAHFHHHMYWPDYEYTALGCVQQHQWCIAGSPGYCLNPGDRLTVLTPKSQRNENIKAIYPHFQRYSWIPEIPSAIDFVRSRGILAMTVGASYNNALNWRAGFVTIDPLRQWVWDVTAWFESSVLLYRAYLFAVVSGDRVGTYYHKDSDGEILRKRRQICGSFLLVDSDFTNINFLGLMLILGPAAILTAFSHMDRIRMTAKYLTQQCGKAPNDVVRNILRRSARLPGLFAPGETPPIGLAGSPGPGYELEAGPTSI